MFKVCMQITLNVAQINSLFAFTMFLAQSATSLYYADAASNNHIFIFTVAENNSSLNLLMCFN